MTKLVLAVSGSYFSVEEIGSWWSAQAQIDLVAVQRDRRSVLVGKARWRRQPMTMADLETLQAKARLWLGDERGWDVWYALYSRDGFTPELQTRASKDAHLLLRTPADVMAPAG